jgi:two-component system LytT family sensor kinase
MKIDYFIKPGWKNLLALLIIWYTGVILYCLIGLSSYSLWDNLIFYSRYSWPNFVLCYVIIVWLFPKYLLGEKYALLLLLNVFLIALYILVRYKNNLLQNPSTYSYYIDTPKNSSLHQNTLLEIISMETMRGLQFTFIAYTYRFAFNRVISDRTKRSLENEHLKAELSLLRHQMNPHFLFNIINDIYYLALIKSDKTAETMLKLSDLLRYILFEKEEWAPLEKEINYLTEYIHLHKIRFPDNVVNFELINAELIQNHKIPPMLLSTFVENAFKHGAIGTDENPIKIMTGVSLGSLHYTVINPINKNIIKDKTSGIGILNLEKRLNLLFPNKHTLSYSNNEEHFEAKLEIQLRYDKSNSSR